MLAVTKSVTGRRQNGDETGRFAWAVVTKSVTSLYTIYIAMRAGCRSTGGARAMASKTTADGTSRHIRLCSWSLRKNCYRRPNPRRGSLPWMTGVLLRTIRTTRMSGETHR